MMARLALIGVPSNSSGTRDGVAKAPDALRKAGLVERLRQRADTEDLLNPLDDTSGYEPSSDRDPESGVIDPNGLRHVVSSTSEAVDRALGSGRFPLVVGGDCPLLLGCLAAAETRGRDHTGLLFADGHEDAYPPHRSPTGEAADMELGFALGLAKAPPRIEFPILEPQDVVILGARDGSTLRTEGVRSLRGIVPLVDDAELSTDPELMTKRAAASLPETWWLHVDLDVLSTEALEAVDYPQIGGIGWTDLGTLTREALYARPIGMDVTIYNPDLDRGGRDAARIVSYLSDAARLLASL